MAWWAAHVVSAGIDGSTRTAAARPAGVIGWRSAGVLAGEGPCHAAEGTCHAAEGAGPAAVSSATDERYEASGGGRRPLGTAREEEQKVGADLILEQWRRSPDQGTFIFIEFLQQQPREGRGGSSFLYHSATNSDSATTAAHLLLTKAANNETS